MNLNKVLKNTYFQKDYKYALGKAYFAGKRLYTQLLIKKKGGDEIGNQ